MKCGPYGLTEALSVIAVWMSMRRTTVVVAAFALLAAFVSFGVETETASLIVAPSAVEPSVFTTKAKLPLVPPAAMMVFEVQVNVPVPPAAGTPVQVKFAGGVKGTKVVFAGTVSVRVMGWFVALCAMFVKSCVYVMFCPA